MCGICGTVTLDGELDHDLSTEHVNLMVDALMHRGPDDTGIKGDRNALFGMTRLAIRGIADGKQPIIDAETGVMMACNGEIDNHRELRAWLLERGRTVEQSTDVAVIPPLYLELGPAFIEKLKGAFAVAVWDPRNARLLLARDRAGERPLFFSVRNGRVTFASLIAALVTGESEPFPVAADALKNYLQSGYFAAPATPFEDIRKVSPGETVSIDTNGVKRSFYWRWPVVKTPKKTPALECFDQVFQDAVRRQSEADVEVGCFLSGGLDSSLITAVTRSIRPEKPLTAFSLRFSEASYDEGHFAEQVAGKLGVNFVPVWVRPEDFPPTIRQLVRQTGEPLADPAWVPTALLARRAAQSIKVALVGEGADELFGGYPTYFGAGLAEYYAKLPRPVRSAIKRIVENWPPSDKKVTLVFLLKRFIQGDHLDYLGRHLLWTSSIQPDVLTRLGVPAPNLSKTVPSSAAMLDLLQRHDLETSLAEGLLTKADRASMKSALELRAPFLDTEVMEFIASLPPKQRIHRLQTKVFLKEYALRYLPREIVHRKKRGLSVPLSSWLREPLSEWAESKLSSGLLEQLGINTKTALDLFQEHRKRKADHARALWTLVVLAEWLEWNDEVNGEPPE